MDEDNLTRQADEVEALAAIYEDEWCVVDEAARIFCIKVTDGSSKPKWSVSLQVHMPSDYPSDSPPTYQLNAPWLRGDERRTIQNSLEEIYLENTGEIIIYLWVEKIREFLVDKVDQDEGHEGSGSPRRVTHISEETEHDDDFDHSVITDDEKLSELTLTVELSPSKTALVCPVIHHGTPVTDRRSTFQPHLAEVFCKEHIQMVIDKLYENKKIANATHNMLAYRIYKAEPFPSFIQSCYDDGETHAGSRMLHLMKIMDVQNVLVVVSRWFGGILLGPDRFKHINNCTRTILTEHGYTKEKDDVKKGPKSKK